MARLKKAPERHFPRRAGGKGGMPPFRGEGMKAVPVPIDPRLTQPRSRRNHRTIPRAGFPLLQGKQFVLSQGRQPPGHGFQIIEQKTPDPEVLA